MKKRGAYTLIELMVSMMIFLIFVSAMVCITQLSLAYWTHSKDRIVASQNALLMLEFIATEAKEAVLKPSNSSPVLLPTPSPSPTTSEFKFTEPNFTNYNPADPNWDVTNPNNYQQVRFYIQNNNTFCREVTTYDSSGQAQTPTTQQLVVTDNGQLKLTAVVEALEGGYIYCLEVQAMEGKKVEKSQVRYYVVEKHTIKIAIPSE